MNKIKTTDYLITANSTALLAYVFVFQTQIDNTIVKWLIFISFSFFVVSLCLMMWYRFRYPQRNKYYKELMDESTKKNQGRYRSFYRRNYSSIHAYEDKK